MSETHRTSPGSQAPHQEEAGELAHALSEAAGTIRGGGVLVYPTEAVYGLGCDPQQAAAVERILRLKGRPADKGLILIADELTRLEPFLEPLDEKTLATVMASWPGPVTWALPARATVPRWLRGAHETLAVRVTAHPVAAELCRRAGTALVSTSANRSGQPAARTAAEVTAMLGDKVDYVVRGAVGTLDKPSEIRDARTGEILRAGA